ncbi:hypothetical protein ACHAWF_010703 [Thalassiosira exigua]
MADHDEDVPDVDYEGEEEEDHHHHPPTPAKSPAKSPAKAAGSAGIATAGAGDSETDDDDDGDEGGAGPRPAPPAGAGGGSPAGRGEGDSETDSEGEEGGGSGGGVGGGGGGGGGRRRADGGGEGGRKDGAPPPRKDETKDGEDGLLPGRGGSRAVPSGMDRALAAPREGPPPAPERFGRGEGERPRDGGRDRGYGREGGGREFDRGGGRGGGSRWGERDGGRGGGSRWGGRADAAGQRKQPPEDYVGVYIPPAKRAALEEQRKAAEAEGKAGDKEAGEQAPRKAATPAHVQRQTWEALTKSINGTINRLSPATIKPLIHALFSEINLVRGRGLLVRSVLRASQASPKYTPAYAALMAVVNTKLPECGELLLTRCVLVFRRSYQRRDRSGVSSILSLMGHLFNQGLAHELLTLQVLTVLLDGDPTEDSVDVAAGYFCVVGRRLTEVSPAGVRAVTERLRGLLHEGTVGRRGQYRIEAALKVKKGGFADYPAIPDEEELDLVEREDQITFEIGLDDEGLKSEEELDRFRFDEGYDDKEEEWKAIRTEILGEDSASGSGSESGSESESESESEDEQEAPPAAPSGDAKKTVVVEDLTEADLVHLRRTIYLTIMSSATFEECTHKLAKMDIPPGRENEMINMIIECCSQERTFLRYYGLVSGRFCLLDERWQDAFESAFGTQYDTIHRLETNKLRNVAKLFGHLLHTDAVSWQVLSRVHLNEDETTSSSRIFVKILVQEMAEAMGMAALKRRFDSDNADPDEPAPGGGEGAVVAAPAGGTGRPHGESSVREWFRGMFPKDNARNTRYAINFFTSIGLGPLTDGMREFLKNAPKLILARARAEAEAKEAAKDKEDDESSVISASSSDTSSFDSSSSSESSSSGGSSSSGSRSSYSSSSRSYSSSSSGDRYRRRKGRDRRRGRDRKKGGRRRSRSYSSSSSSSGSDSSSDSRGGRGQGRRGGGRDKDRRSKDGRDGRRPSKEGQARDDAGRGDDPRDGGAPTLDDAGSSRRSVSESPPARRGARGDRGDESDGDRRRGQGKRSRSPAGSRGPSSGSSRPARKTSRREGTREDRGGRDRDGGTRSDRRGTSRK